MLSATINRYAYGSLSPRQDGQVRVESVDFGMSMDMSDDDALTFDGRLDLVRQRFADSAAAASISSSTRAPRPDPASGPRRR